jgi:hypothetical protein
LNSFGYCTARQEFGVNVISLDVPYYWQFCSRKQEIKTHLCNIHIFQGNMEPSFDFIMVTDKLSYIVP